MGMLRDRHGRPERRGVEVFVVFSEDHRLHNPTRELVMGREVDVYDRVSRAEEVVAALRSRGHEVVRPVEHGIEPLRGVHDRHYLDHLEGAWTEWEAQGWSHPVVPDTIPLPRMLAGAGIPPATIRGRAGWYVFDTATPLVAGTWGAARAAADCALTAADHVLEGHRCAFAVCRPPGHHAGIDFAGGYCFLNNAAIAVGHLRRHAGGRTAVLDLDFHHGNGTQQIFWTDPDVLTVSIHGDPDRQYPYFTGRAGETGEGAGAGANLNLPQPAGIGDDDYLRVVGRAADRIAAFDPSHLVVPLGVDTYADDPLGDFTLTTEGYRRLGRSVGSIGLPTLVALEGGYAVEAIGRNVSAFVEGLEAGAEAT